MLVSDGAENLPPSETLLERLIKIVEMRGAELGEMKNKTIPDLAARVLALETTIKGLLGRIKQLEDGKPPLSLIAE